MESIEKMSDSLENNFFDNKNQLKNYKIEPNTLSVTKRSVVSAKENYSNKEKKWFEEFINLK